MNELKKRFILIDLRNRGYDATYDADKDAIMPNHRDFPNVGIKEDGFLLPKLDGLGWGHGWTHIFSTEQRTAHQRDFVYQEFEPIRARAVELAYAWENAAPMTTEGVSNFRLLSEHGKVVFAARDDGANGFNFATWQYNYDREGFEHGHYTRDYEAAKKDFAVRSGLISADALFAPEQLKQIYSALVFQGKNDDSLTFDTEKDLQAVIEKLEELSPDLKDSISEGYSAEQEAER